MTPLFEIVGDLRQGANVLRRRSHGVIEVVDGRFHSIRLRPFPKLISTPEVIFLGARYHGRRPGDRLLLYYDQPWRFPNYLTLKYVVSARQTSLGTLTRALDVLDEIARLKQSDALLCDVGNWRITTNVLRRWGWQQHCPSRFHRHFIKRFYGAYPTRPRWLQERRQQPSFESHDSRPTQIA